MLCDVASASGGVASAYIIAQIAGVNPVHHIAVLQRGSEGRRFVGVFSLKAASAPVAVELPDGSYENLIDGAKITVQNGTLFCTGAPVILCTEKAES